MAVQHHGLALELRHITRDMDNDWESIEPDHAAVWSEAAWRLASRTYFHDGCTASVSVNWHPLAERLKYLHELRRQVYSPEPPPGFDWSPFWEPVSLAGKVLIDGENKTSEYGWYASFFGELYAYDVFTILNLAYPGVCNFLNLRILAKAGEVVAEPRLPGYSFDFAMVDTLAGEWPVVKTLPLEQVVRWHSALKLGTKQVAETAVEKLLFAMLHLVKREDYADAVIWIFYALEALVETRVGESISTLVRRISLLLSLTEAQRGLLNKQIRSLYDFRSAVVHGGYQVAHPIAQEVIDRTVGDRITRSMNLFQFGFTIIVACLQALISRGWTAVTFEEQMRGVGDEL